MVQPKYNPQESLERVKLLMKYDSKKTLTENRQVIFEEESTPKMVTAKDLIGDSSLWANINWSKRKGVKGVVDALDGWVDMEDLQFVLETIKSLDGWCFYDDATQKNISATEAFVMLYKEDENGDELKKDVEGVGTRTLPTGAEQLKRSIIGTIDAQIAKGCSSSGGGGGGGGGGGKRVPFKECSGKYYRGCKAEAIRKVQECLGGLVVDGKFGGKTEGKLKEKFPDKEYWKFFVDADVDVICGKSTPQPTQSTPTPTPTPSAEPTDDREEITVYDPNDVVG